MPGPQTSRLFNRAREHRIGFAVGYCELTPRDLADRRAEQRLFRRL